MSTKPACDTGVPGQPVAEPEQAEASEMSAEPEAKTEKRVRKRMKKLYAQIQEQMEFYFSDSNLHRDRFLKQLMDKTSDGFVDINVFSKFNKLRTIVTDLTLVAKALQNSDLIEVSSDGQKLRRKTPLCDPQDIDHRTVYVECLPSAVDHDWIKKQFSSCGKVAYVSLPKYKTTGDIKGFAFVEFESKEGAEAACALMNNPPADASERPGKFPKYNKETYRMQKVLAQKADKIDEAAKEVKVDVKAKRRKRRRMTSESSTEGLDDSHHGGKRRKSDSVSSNEDRHPSHKDDIAGSGRPSRKRSLSESEIENRRRSLQGILQDDKSVPPIKEETAESVKKSKVEDVSGSEQVREQEKSSDAAAKKRKADDDQTESVALAKRVRISDAVETFSVECNNKKKKKRKRKKKQIKEKEKVKETVHMRVIPRKQWLELRNEYLSLQKENMKNLKKTLSQLKTQGTEKHKAGAEKMEEEKPKNTLQFTEGVIVKVTSKEPMNPKEIKQNLAGVANIVYVDIRDGSEEGHIRCQDAASTQTLLKATPANFTMGLLTGDDEKKYWDKILADRHNKLTNKVRQKKRGRDKIVEKAEKVSADINKKNHVFFEDE